MNNYQPNSLFEPGKTEIVEASVMNISTSFFRDKVMINKDAGHITAIIMQAEDVVYALEKYNGKLLNISRSGISAMFENSSDDALQFAIKLCQDSEMIERKELFRGLSIGIDFGAVCVCTVSSGGLNMPLLMSETIDTTVNLSENAQKYNSRILITSDVASRLSGMSRDYNIRRLGKIYHALSDRSEEIYDVYDGDPVDTKYSKMRSRLFFETGVDLFLKGSFLEARSYFIEILKVDRNDAAAKHYVFQCDNCIAEAGDELEKQYLEIW